jgi:hypothetical protein
VSTQFEKDLYMLQWTMNCFLEGGSTEVRPCDLRVWVDPDSKELLDALRDWERKGFIQIVREPRECKEKEVCVKLLKEVQAVEEPKDLREG